MPPDELVRAIAVASDVPTHDVAYGATCLFCRAGKAAFLERLMGDGAEGGGLGDEISSLGPQLQALLEDFERKRLAMPVLEKYLRMWVHRRRFVAIRRQQRQSAHARSKLQGAIRAVALASSVTGGWAAATDEGKAAQETASMREQEEAAQRIQAAFARRREQRPQLTRQRRSAVGRAFRAAARASLAFSGAAARAKAKAAAFKVDGTYEGTVVHAGHLHMMPKPTRAVGPGDGAMSALASQGGSEQEECVAVGRGAEGAVPSSRPLASATSLLPPGEYYCVLLSSRVLLCFELAEDGTVSGSFDVRSGEATGVRPLELTGHAKVTIARGTRLVEGKGEEEEGGGGTEMARGAHGRQTRLVAPHAVPGSGKGRGASPPTALGFEIQLSDGTHGVERSWRASPALYDERATGAVARAARTWVRLLSATLVPEEQRGSRSSLARTSSAILRLDDNDDDDEGGEEEARNEQGGGKNARKEPAYMAGQWRDGCFYRGDGSVAYYSAPCPDDPYALVHVV